jgi:transposase
MVKKKKKNIYCVSSSSHRGCAEGGSVRRIYSPDYKIKTAKLHLVDGIPLSTIASQSGVCITVLSRWVRQYRKDGPSGFGRSRKRRRTVRLPAPVKERIVAMKTAQPTHGVHRISDILKRMFFMKASHETVRRVLHEESLLPARKAPASRTKQVAKTARPDDEGGSYVNGGSRACT